MGAYMRPLVFELHWYRWCNFYGIYSMEIHHMSMSSFASSSFPRLTAPSSTEKAPVNSSLLCSRLWWWCPHTPKGAVHKSDLLQFWLLVMLLCWRRFFPPLFVTLLIMETGAAGFIRGTAGAGRGVVAEDPVIETVRCNAYGCWCCDVAEEINSRRSVADNTYLPQMLLCCNCLHQGRRHFWSIFHGILDQVWCKPGWLTL